MPSEQYTEQSNSDVNMFIGEPLIAWKFCHQFLSFARTTGIRLAPFAHNKAYEPQCCGEILGLEFNLPEWSVRLGDMKMSILLRLLYAVVDAESVSNQDLMSLNGKLSHYHILVGKAEILGSEYL